MGRPTAADDSRHTPCLCPCHRNEQPTAYHWARWMSRCRGGRCLLPFGRTRRGHRQCRVFPLAGLLRETSRTGETGESSMTEVRGFLNLERRTLSRALHASLALHASFYASATMCVSVSSTPSTW